MLLKCLCAHNTEALTRHSLGDGCAQVNSLLALRAPLFKNEKGKRVFTPEKHVKRYLDAGAVPAAAAALRLHGAGAESGNRSIACSAATLILNLIEEQRTDARRLAVTEEAAASGAAAAAAAALWAHLRSRDSLAINACIGVVISCTTFINLKCGGEGLDRRATTRKNSTL